MAAIPANSKSDLPLPPYCDGRTCRAFDVCPKENMEKLCSKIKELQTSQNNANQTNEKHAQNPHYSDTVLFPQDNRPSEAALPDIFKDAREFSFMSRTGSTFLQLHIDDLKISIENSDFRCKFLVFNQYSPIIDYEADYMNFNKESVLSSHTVLKDLLKKGKDQVEIRVMNHFAPFSFEYYKKYDNTEIIFIRPNFYTLTQPDYRPMFMLKKNDYWFNYFRREFNTLWSKSQVFGKTHKLGTPKRIIIDGPPGSGKTTLLTGRSDRDDRGREFEGSFKESGYTVFSGLINDSIQKMREESRKPNMQPEDDWELFFKHAIDLAIKEYNEAKPDLISFYDRGIITLESFAKSGNYDGRLPDKYYNFVNDRQKKYDDPVFIFHPIPGYIVSPQAGDANIRKFNFEELKELHSSRVAIYKRYGYRVIEIEAPADPTVIKDSQEVKKNLNKRINIIKEELGI
ncbi:MAG: ATP-binding protein [Candidatus Azobacteroides sp.]|nr:ATP-binding protein [Candidatus Azobacteroides sp.]